MAKELKVAISGTFLTGKSLITQTLSLLTGMPLAEVTNKSLLLKYFPNKKLEQFSIYDYFQLDIIKFLELAIQESNLQGGFWSNGEFIQQYAASLLNINEYYRTDEKSPIHRALKAVNLIFDRKTIKKLYHTYGNLIKLYSERTYHSVIHFPVEFPVEGIEAINNLNKKRMEYDKLIIKFLADLTLKHYIITGNLEEKLTKILEIYDLKPMMNIETAIAKANLILKKNEPR